MVDDMLQDGEVVQRAQARLKINANEVKNVKKTSPMMHVVGTDAYTMLMAKRYIMGEPEQYNVGSEGQKNGERKTGGVAGF